MLNHINRLQIRAKRAEGFTLIEILVAMSIFLIVTAGVTSMMIISVRSTVGARLGTLAKEAVQQELETVRARTYYVPYSNDPDVGTTGDVDILDRYFPDTSFDVSIDTWGWQGWYTRTASDSYYTVVSPEDSNSIVITIQARFVDYSGNVVFPVSTYDSNVAGLDSPPSDLLAVTVTASWLSRGNEESYSIDSLISRADQASQGGSNDNGGESGCSSSSQSSIDVTAGSLTIYAGASQPYTSILRGNLGDASGTARYDCTSSLTANSSGGSLILPGGDTYSAASASAIGPPTDSDSSGPVSIGPTSSWPKLYLGNSSASSTVESNDDVGELSTAADSGLAGATIQLQQVDDSPSGLIPKYIRWDFLNPVFEVDSVDADAARASISQADGASMATGHAFYDEINLLPVQVFIGSAPSALQGLIVIRDFEAIVISEASQVNGSASNTVAYSATVGMFNLSKASTCSGDSCYDFYAISEVNPLQTAINLNNSNYKLQNALVSEWHSLTAGEIAATSYAAGDGSEAMVSIDALMKISVDYASEIRQQTIGLKEVEVVSKQGMLQLWLGGFDISVLQNE